MISRQGEKTETYDRRFPRVLLIGLDGATFDVLDPLMAAGRMPNLKSLIDGGASGVLESTKPPITPAAWTTFMTGKGPGRHGIIDFVRYDPATNALTLNNNTEISQNAKTIWQILSDKQYKVGSINVPMTYPPEEVNGFMISGFDTPHGRDDFTHPPELRSELFKRFPDYTHEKKWERKAGGGIALFKKNLEYINDSFERGYALAEMCGKKYGWDVMMVLYKLVDNLQHKAWRYLDTRTRDRDPARRNLTEVCFERLDVAIGKLVALARKNDATVIVMSDHGHGSLDGKAQPNLLLARWGYLGLRSPFSRALTRTSVWWNRYVGKNGSFAALANMNRDLAIDWAHSRACVLHAGIYGFLYLNLRGRQPDGIVEQKDYESTRAEIRERLLSARCPDRDGNDMQIFPAVHITEELYNCDRNDHPWLPDLLLSPAPGLAVVKKIRGSSPVRWVPFSRMEGTHRLEGIVVANGPRIASGKRIRAHIADIAPTILAGLGERVPKDMEGRVIHEMFDRKISVRYEPPQERRVEEAPVLSEAQVQDVTDRLSDLGYLE
ncbi:MAG: alkaline phosphatase family protein [Planctomycetota bacterium]|nr:alkaline phosphatase family protein [Planctomycetota bacterium]